MFKAWSSAGGIILGDLRNVLGSGALAGSR